MTAVSAGALMHYTATLPKNTVFTDLPFALQGSDLSAHLLR